MKTILVTGGLGYIGSHTSHMLIEQGYNVIIFDSLEHGHKRNLPHAATFYQGDIRNKEDLDKVFAENAIDAVVHFAGYLLVGESMTDPAKYFDNNVYGSLLLLEVMRKYNVHHIVFSSSAAVYGEVPSPIGEDATKNPESNYGLSKLMVEQILDTHEAYGIKSVCLRYFNASGAAYGIGEDHDPETHLIPLVLQVALGERDFVYINGTDYDTPDRTCVRDYVHVLDLAEAHILALKHLANNGESLKLNVATGKGTSVKEIIELGREVTGHPIPAVERGRRPGDPSTLIASPTKIMETFKWSPKYTIKEIMQSAWEWHKSHKDGN